MANRNFRVKNGLSIGDITIDASTNLITGLSTATPVADGDVATKKYVDNGLNGLSQNSISQGDSSVTVTDSGTGSVTITVDGNQELTIADSGVTVAGNLTVNGTTTTVSSTNTTISDNLLELNSGATSNANDSGFIIERGSTGDNAIFMWDESADEFTLGTTTATASDTGDLSVATGTLRCTVTSAQYSDVAERFASDTALEPGTVVALGGAAEITAVAEEASDEVFGVVSSIDQAAVKMNSAAGTDSSHPYVAMTGRVQVKVTGAVNKGDRLISASMPGYARAATKAECTAFNVIGRALTSKNTSGTGTVLAAVRVSH